MSPEAVDGLLRELHAHETSPAGIRQLATHGDVSSARSVLEDFVARWLGGATDFPSLPISVGAAADNFDLMTCLARLATRMLEQPDAALATGLGYQNLRQSPEARILHRVIFFAVEALVGSEEQVTQAEAFALIAEASYRFAYRELFATGPIDSDNVQQMFRRAVKSDPMGPGLIPPSF